MTLLEAATQMQQAGISLDVGAPGGGRVRLPAGDVERYVRDAEAYWASRYGVDVDAFRQWQQALEHGGMVRCSATTGKGKPCRGVCYPDELQLSSPVKFAASMPYHCPSHRPPSP